MPKFKDLTGQKINNWNIIKQEGFTKHGASKWLVECDCEKKTRRIKDVSQLKNVKSCGCMNIENLNGKQFGRWTAISDPIFKNGRVFFKCICSCENKTVSDVRSDGLKNGTSTSCGCYKLEMLTKTGMSRDRIYGIWDGMIRRCYDESNKRYLNYGGRGITVCDEWINDFMSFYQWAIENGYEKHLTIERVDVDQNYEPLNCCWITMEEQAKNKTNTIYITLDNGETHKLIDFANKNNFSRETILKRYNNGIVNKETLLQTIPTDNTSGIIGVSYSNSQENWRAYINFKNKRIELGSRKNKEEAIRLRLSAELKYFGLEHSPQKCLFNEYKIGEELNE